MKMTVTLAPSTIAWNGRPQKKMPSVPGLKPADTVGGCQRSRPSCASRAIEAGGVRNVEYLVQKRALAALCRAADRDDSEGRLNAAQEVQALIDQLESRVVGTDVEELHRRVDVVEGARGGGETEEETEERRACTAHHDTE